MTGQATLTGIPTASGVDADLRSRGADYTPRAVARECLRVALAEVVRLMGERIGKGPLEVLDVCAGAGCWSQALRELWAYCGWTLEQLRITAVELDPRDRPHLERHADRVIIGDYRTALDRRYHLAIGNPDFALLRAPEVVTADAPRGAVNVGGKLYDVACSMPAQLLAHCDAVALLHRQQAWSKDGPGVAVRRAYPAAFAWDIPGSLRFRAPGSRNPETGKLYGSDQHNYSVSLWLPGHTGPTQTSLLRDFTPAERRWTVRPGTER
jgi:hypothetical protein